MARLVVTRELVALVAWAALRARWARTPQACSAVPAVLAAALGLPVMALLVRQARLVPSLAALVALAAQVVLAAPAAIAEPAAPAVLVLADPVPAVLLAWRALVALVAVAVSAAPAGMRVVSAMARLVAMPDKVALVAWAALRAHRAATPQRWLAPLAARAAPAVWLVMVQRGRLVPMAPRYPRME
jgi:hypothetical protein